jgi:hypothetical protein
MLALRPPRGWVELEAHLEDDHGLPREYVCELDADLARKVHEGVHRAGTFAVGRQHTHGGD